MLSSPLVASMGGKGWLFIPKILQPRSEPFPPREGILCRGMYWELPFIGGTKGLTIHTVDPGWDQQSNEGECRYQPAFSESRLEEERLCGVVVRWGIRRFSFRSQWACLLHMPGARMK